MNEKILIIDDEKEITELIEVFLKNESYQVFKTYSAKETLRRRLETKLITKILAFEVA